MAKLIIRIEKEDVVTSRIGDNYMIKAQGMDFIFTPEALEELSSDFTSLQLEDDSKPSSPPEFPNDSVEKYWTPAQILLWIVSAAAAILFFCVCFKASL